MTGLHPVDGCSEYNSGGGGSATHGPDDSGHLGPLGGGLDILQHAVQPAERDPGGRLPDHGSSQRCVTGLGGHVHKRRSALHRSITIWPQTEMAIGSAEYDGFDTDYTQAHYYIIDSLNVGLDDRERVHHEDRRNFITLAYNVPTTLYFAATAALGSTTQAFGTNVLTPFEAYFALTGIFSDGTLFGETIPYPYGIITQANAYTTPTAGATGGTVTVSCTTPCHFNANAKAMVGWINSAGQADRSSSHAFNQ